MAADVQRTPALWGNRAFHSRAAPGFEYFVPCFHICPELDTFGLKHSQDTTWGHSVNPALAVLCRLVDSAAMGCCTPQGITQWPGAEAGLALLREGSAQT